MRFHSRERIEPVQQQLLDCWLPKVLHAPDSQHLKASGSLARSADTSSPYEEQGNAGVLNEQNTKPVTAPIAVLSGYLIICA